MTPGLWTNGMDWSVVVALAVGAAIALLVARWLGRAGRSRVARRRARTAGDGERQARRLLEEAGYRVEGAQVTHRWAIEVDGEVVSVLLRADFLASRGGRRFVADAKTGGEAPSVTTAATRRQLLEYLVAYDVDGVLLVDAAAARIHEVRFRELA